MLIKLEGAKEDERAMEVSIEGLSEEEKRELIAPEEAMRQIAAWLRQTKSRPMFFSDNNGFDWQFVNWYFWHFLGENPLGHSSQNIGSLYKAWSRTCFRPSSISVRRRRRITLWPTPWATPKR